MFSSQKNFLFSNIGDTIDKDTVDIDFQKYIKNNTLSNRGKRVFQDMIYAFYKKHGRSFQWRSITNPYYILVSEVMLQQTQTHRVIYKFQEFIEAFPNINTLAHAKLSDVLQVWQGLGFNRRAYNLHSIVDQIVNNYKGKIPQDPNILLKLKGLGFYTANSICAFAYNIPTVLIETNIRAVFIYHFFQDKKSVKDKEILPLIEQTMDKTNPRQWYYALMDYGVYLKKHYSNPTRKSTSYTKQSKFEGSDRQIRSFILKLLLKHKYLSHENLLKHVAEDLNYNLNQEKVKQRIESIIEILLSEKLMLYSEHFYTLP